MINIKIFIILKNLNIDEDKTLIDADLILDINTFRDLVNVISINVIRRIKKKWLLLYKLTNEAGIININLGLYKYELFLQFSFFCKHYLL